MQDLKVATIQSNIFWHKVEENRSHFTSLINQIKEKVDLVVLPEMFTTGFTMKPEEVAEDMAGETIKWMQNIAADNGFAICGSIVVEEDNKYYNRFIFVFPSREIKTYNKRHLFSLAGEEKVYSAGKEKVIIEYNGWRICPQVCYDLRFPVFARNVEAYDLLLYVANWPKKRILAWDTLLQARAIENLSYVIGVNRVGVDPNKFEYNGHSIAYNTLGAAIIPLNQENEITTVVTLSKKHISETRKRLNFLNDCDSFKLLH
ncbi:Predicted amidohydrolase [Lutibacter oricola]|uniref:Omega-amidase YafV n=1 Tax=Lutibacter oricola TaxID=762486 RepID=A0A1H3G3U6_9FLAO|nr:amidohydrolase [Lutibacter oricola]SDX97368.1 Predicted amidohydrolase [Lutibacter oricola]